MPTKTVFQRCILSVVAHGFDEADTIRLITILRQAGLCVKSLGMTSGLVSGAYGIYLMPDLILSDLEDLVKIMSFGAVILPENQPCLSRLETDPRLHNFLRQVLVQGGQVIAGANGRQFLKKIAVTASGSVEGQNRGECLLLPHDFGEPLEAFTRDLLYRIGQRARGATN